ncbi:MAG: autotransporter outer membrane beta-barrel domain-containing protein [Verrucomicrobiales bacterium]|nr:autotransporter outer membrane beta-barrel domain-containing protein [Verrucomicrobiales bacterium]
MKTPNMKTRNLTLILTLLCALGVSALNVFAENKVVTSGTWTEADKTYEAVSNQAALQVSGRETLYEGTNITLSSTFNSTSNGSKYGAYVYSQGQLTLTGGTITTSGSTGYGIYLTGSATGLLRDVTIKTTGYAGMGINGSNGSQVVADGLDITTEGDRAFAFYGADCAITNSTITTSGSNALGLVATYFAGSGSGQLIAEQVKVETYGILGNGVELAGSTLTTSVITVRLTDVEVTTFNERASAINVGNGVDSVRILVVDGGRYTAQQGNALNVNDGASSQTTAILQNYSINNDFTIKGGAVLSGTSALTFSSILTSSDGQQVDVPTVTTLRVEEHVTLIGDANFKGSATSTVSLDDNSSLTGRVNAIDSSRTELNLADSTLTGDLTANDHSTLTVTASNGATITGTVSGNDDAVIDLTVSGTGSIIISDINQNYNAAVTVTISDGATGSGGYNGGNLITGGDSTWTFNQDSHGNYGENHGTWNIGDYDVTFDNLTHTGTLNLSVNTDTGDGGSITVETATGDGTVHVDTTGDGQLNPNDVLPGLITGDGTEHWQWDPIDWGIEEIVKDGDHFVKKGTSPAGAVLNSAIAVQQSMWFAQQNSLLKRMGELRYGARASRPQLPGGRDPRAPNDWLDNIWVRSYGQQANINTGISGLKGFSETQYGVDLGTDHAWLIDDHHTLYTGVFAGYGGADRDFHSGYHGSTDSGYGGLYGTWLHKDGWYADALAKGQYFDTSFDGDDHGSYHSYGVGLSLELGRQFQFADGWFAEPSVQVSYLHLLNDGYATDSGMAVGLADSDIVQFYGGARLGRNIKLNQDGWLQPYVKVGGVEQLSSGGQVRAGGGEWRPATDGARGVLGAGIVYQLTAADQLHLDYEASFGDKYDKPWGLTAGYRHQF